MKLVVENSAEYEEQCILDTYEPAPVYESDADVNDIQVVAVVAYQVAREVLEPFVSFVFKTLVNLQRGEQMEDLLYREKRDIEGLQGMLAGHSITQPLYGIPPLYISL